MQVATIMRETGKIISAMVMEKCIGIQAMKSTLGTGLTTSKVVLVLTYGWTQAMTTSCFAIDMLVIGKTA